MARLQPCISLPLGLFSSAERACSTDRIKLLADSAKQVSRAVSITASSGEPLGQPCWQSQPSYACGSNQQHNCCPKCQERKDLSSESPLWTPGLAHPGPHHSSRTHTMRPPSLSSQHTARKASLPSRGSKPFPSQTHTCLHWLSQTLCILQTCAACLWLLGRYNQVNTKLRASGLARLPWQRAVSQLGRALARCAPRTTSAKHPATTHGWLPFVSWSAHS